MRLKTTHQTRSAFWITFLLFLAIICITGARRARALGAVATLDELPTPKVDHTARVGLQDASTHAPDWNDDPYWDDEYDKYYWIAGTIDNFNGSTDRDNDGFYANWSFNMAIKPGCAPSDWTKSCRGLWYSKNINNRTVWITANTFTVRWYSLADEDSVSSQTFEPNTQAHFPNIKPNTVIFWTVQLWDANLTERLAVDKYVENDGIPADREMSIESAAADEDDDQVLTGPSEAPEFEAPDEEDSYVVPPDWLDIGLIDDEDDECESP